MEETDLSNLASRFLAIILSLILFIFLIGLTYSYFLYNMETKEPCIKYETKCYYTTYIMIGKFLTSKDIYVDCSDIRSRVVDHVCLKREKKVLK